MNLIEARLIIKNRFSEFEEGDPWWHRDDCETYLKLLAQLVNKGFTPEEALVLLSSAYGAAANEFGS